MGNVYDPGGIFGTTSTVDVSVNGTQVKAVTNSEMGTTQQWMKFKVHFTASSTPTSINRADRVLSWSISALTCPLRQDETAPATDESWRVTETAGIAESGST